jgi:hypothetical protein
MEHQDPQDLLVVQDLLAAQVVVDLAVPTALADLVDLPDHQVLQDLLEVVVVQELAVAPVQQEQVDPQELQGQDLQL